MTIEVYASANLSAMPSYGRFYVLGSPVEGASDVAGLVEYVMRRTSDMRAAVFSVHDVEGPVRFDSSCGPLDGSGAPNSSEHS